MLSSLYRFSVIISAAMVFSGCATEFNLATQQEESLIYGTEKEVLIGEKVSVQVEKNYKINTDVDINERVQKIFDRIIEVCDRKDIVYVVKVIDEDELNAVSLPGGYVYIHRGVVEAADNDDQIAGVLAHEVGHITARHGIKRMQSYYGYALVQAAGVASGDGNLARGMSTAYVSIFLAHSREHEFEADKLGVKYLKKAGYDPNEMAGFLKKLHEEQKEAPLRKIGYWRTHPYLPQRIAIVNQEVKGQLEFKDYLNLTGDDL